MILRFSLFISFILVLSCSNELSEDEKQIASLFLLKKGLPSKLNSYLKWTDISINSKRDWVYTYETDYEALRKTDSAIIKVIGEEKYLETRKKGLYGVALENYLNAPDMIYFRKNKIDCIYNHHDLDGKLLFSFKVPGFKEKSITKTKISNEEKNKDLFFQFQFPTEKVNINGTVFVWLNDEKNSITIKTKFEIPSVKILEYHFKDKNNNTLFAFTEGQIYDKKVWNDSDGSIITRGILLNSVKTYAPWVALSRNMFTKIKNLEIGYMDDKKYAKGVLELFRF